MVPVEHGSGFAKYLEHTGVREAKALAGNRGAYVKTIIQDAYCHFFLCTIWESWQDIARFAGEPPSAAVTYPEDAVYGLISDPIAVHQQVSTADNPFLYTPCDVPFT